MKKSKEVQVDVHIARVHSSMNGDYISFRIECQESGIQFVDMDITMEQFGALISGSYTRGLTANVSGLEKVGKKHVREVREVFCPITTYDREKLREWLEENAQEDGYEISTYLGSKDSVKSVDGGQILRYSVHKWI